LVEMSGIAYVNGQSVCEASMLAQVVRDRAPKEIESRIKEKA
jgi:hypothetical protein